MQTRVIGPIAGVIIGIILGVSSFAWTQSDHARNSSDSFRNLALFEEVLATAKASYVEEIDETEAVEAAIDGMLSSLDPHSGYLSDEEFESMRVQSSGQYGGLGIEITGERGFIKVISPMDGTPADRAGIETGDLITAVDGESIFGLTVNDAVKLMRGAPGDDITITIFREGLDPYDVTLTRETIKLKSVTYRVIDDDIVYFRISGFTKPTTRLLKAAIADSRDEIGSNPAGVILDLRNNGGGLLDQAISVTDLFLAGGEVVSTRGRKPNDVFRFGSHNQEAMRGVPVVVLINNGSASASEIVAGALQDHGRAVILGMTSFGKGSVQSIVPLGTGKGAIKLTTGRYYTPSGRSIQMTGIEPDIEVSARRLSEEDIEKMKSYSEDNLSNALDHETGAKRRGPTLPDYQPPEDYEGDDYQLDRAIDVLRNRLEAKSETRAG